MKITYQVGYKNDLDSDESFDDLLANELQRAFADEYEEVGEADVFDYFQVHYEHPLNEDESLIAFELDIPTVGTEIQQVRLMQDINKRIRALEGVFMLFKFHDESLFSSLQKLYAEIFGLEMKLREIATLIFADTYQSNYLDHIQETKVKLTSTEINQGGNNKEDRLKSRFENEFFHISFSDYHKLLEPRELKEPDLLNIASKAETFEDFRDYVRYRGVQKEDYRDFFATIKPHMNALEKVRNCVAHSRVPSSDELQKFELAKAAVQEAMNSFFADLRQAQNEEMGQDS